MARALRASWNYREAIRTEFNEPETIPDAKDRTFALIDRLESSSGRARTDAIERFSLDENLEEVVAAIERDINAAKPEAALDRLHTYCMKKFAHLLRAHGVEVGSKDTLNGRAGQFFNMLRQTGHVRPISAKIMKGTVEVFELYNGIRNNESLADDNIIVEASEARFIFDAVHNMLRFLKSIEAVSGACDGSPDVSGKMGKPIFPVRRGQVPPRGVALARARYRAGGDHDRPRRADHGHPAGRTVRAQQGHSRGTEENS